jgi:hypothetical protein
MATDVEAVLEAIRGVTLCIVCIARKVGLAPLSVISALATIGQRVQITDAVERCHDCLYVKNTHRASLPTK